jgi:putative phosphoesterase
MTVTRILLVGDTHAFTWDEVPARIREATAEADIAVHAGDIVRWDVVEGFRAAARRAIVVHGNSDPVELRQGLPYREVFEVDGLRIGVTHPSWAGPEFEPDVLRGDFPEGVDVILYGHLHITVNEVRDGVLYLNGGQGYASFLVPGTIAWLTIEDGRPRGEIETFEGPR